MEKKLPKGAYGGVEGSKYVPYIKSNEGIKELSKQTIIIGIILAMVFAASNAYAGMISGLTVAAGIPGAILGAGLMRMFAKKNSALNTTIIQGMASGGESVASGMIFVLPAVILIGQEITFVEGFIAGLAGVLLGIAATNLVHKYLIVEEHGSLIYPEAMAISETIVTSEAGGDSLKFMGIGAAISTVFTIISNTILGIANTTVAYTGSKIKWQWYTDVNPLLLGIGFIVGLEVALGMFAGSVLSNFVIIPLIGYFTAMADGTQVAWNNADLQLVEMTAANIQGSYTKYIGAGMMLAGGLIGAIKLIPTIITSVKSTLGSAGGDNKTSNFSKMLILAGVVTVALAAFVVTEQITQVIVGFILAVIFIVIFAIVASKMTGDIGTSNLPVSGMTIASLLIVTLVFLVLGWTTPADNKAVLLLGTVIVSGIAISGGYAQSHKVAFIMGGSKDDMEKGFVLASIAGVFAVSVVILLLASQIGTTIFPPQADLMATLTQGVLTKNLPWTIIFVGALMAIVLYMLKLPIMTVAIGFYLPMGTVTIILFGALLRVLVQKLYSNNKEECEKRENNGIILSAGLVAGGAIVGLIGSALAIFTTETGNIADAAYFVGSSAEGFFGSNACALILLVALCALTLIPITRKIKE